MQNFQFDIQRFSAVYEFTTGTKTFSDKIEVLSSKVYYGDMGDIDCIEATIYAELYGEPGLRNVKDLQVGWKGTETFTFYNTDSLNKYLASLAAHQIFWYRRQEITLSGDHRILRGTETDDVLKNYGANGCKLYGNGGNDFIGSDGGTLLTIDGGEGDDEIYNQWLKSSTIYGGAGDDSILIRHGSSNLMIDGGSGNDSIEIWSERGGYDEPNCRFITVTGGAGEDLVWNHGENISIDGGAGDDNIGNWGSNNIIDGGAGNDFIETYYDCNTVNAGAGNDYVFNRGNNNKIYTATDNWLDDNNDFVRLASGSENTVETGWGNDTIDIKAGSRNNSINSGQGNDSIVNAASHISIYAGTSDDTIENYGEYTFIDSGDEYATMDKDSIKNAAANVTIKGCGGNDVIENWGHGVSIDAGAGDDVISLRANTPIDDVWKHLINPLKTFAGEIFAGFFGLNPNELKKALDIVADETKPFNEKIAALYDIEKTYSDNIFDSKVDDIFMNN